MNTLRTIEGDTFEEQFYPNFRKVNFDGAFAVVSVTTHLRDAWKTSPPPYTSSGTWAYNEMWNFMRKNQARRDKGEDLAVIEDKSVETEWREKVYSTYNHVFWDVMKFLEGVGVGIGHIHPPNHGTLSIEYPANGKGQVQKWDTHVLIIPAFLDEGVKIRLTTEKNGETKELDVFSKDTPRDIWWLKKETEVSFQVEGHHDEEKVGLAAVMAIGILCDKDDLPPLNTEDEQDDEEDEDLVDQVQIIKDQVEEFKERAAEEQKEGVPSSE